MRVLDTVKIVGTGDNKAKESIIKQLMKLRNNIDRFIEFNKPKLSGLLVDVEMVFIRGDNVEMKPSEKAFLLSLEDLNLYERNSYNETQLGHTLQRESMVALDEFLRKRRNRVTIKIHHLYAPRHAKSWERAGLKNNKKFFDDYYQKVKHTYNILYSILLYAPETSDPLMRRRR